MCIRDRVDADHVEDDEQDEESQQTSAEDEEVLSLMVTVVIAKTIGCVLPIAATVFHMDPAIMAAPLITTIVDGAILVRMKANQGVMCCIEKTLWPLCPPLDLSLIHISFSEGSSSHFLITILAFLIFA